MTATARPETHPEPILTIGHSTRIFEQFADLLTAGFVRDGLAGHGFQVSGFGLQQKRLAAAGAPAIGKREHAARLELVGGVRPKRRRPSGTHLLKPETRCLKPGSAKDQASRKPL